MKVGQEKTFKPIIIAFETSQEAQSLCNLVDKIDGYHCNANGAFQLTQDEYRIILTLSNAFTEGKIKI